MPYKLGVQDKLPADNYIKLFKTDTLPINFKPANFAPYETKIRMAVLVNLLNAVIPAKVTPSKNIPGNADATLFSTDALAFPMNLKDFIYFKNGQYWVNTIAPPEGSVGLLRYLQGWNGGIKTPGMTFWKYGVHSTTFQITVDAFKYDDSARLSSVVTFDSYDDSYDSEVEYDNNTHETKNEHSKPKYELTPSKKLDEDVISTIYLYPKGRANNAANNFVIGNGIMRYPTFTNTDSWRIISSVWSDSFGRKASSSDFFEPVYLFPEDVLNVGADGKSWHFEPHPYTDTAKFKTFFKNASGQSSLYYSAPSSPKPFDYDYSTGAPLRRKYSFGKNSWVQWKAHFSKSMSENSLEIIVTRESGSSEYTMDHKLTFTKKNNAAVVYTLLFSTGLSAVSPQSIPFRITVPIPAGDYDIRLTELKDSSSDLNSAEKITKIVIHEYASSNGFR